MSKRQLRWMGSTLLFLIYLVIILPNEAAKFDMVTPDIMLFYSVSDLALIADQLTDTGRRLYIETRISFDILWPMVYTLFLLSSYALFQKHRMFFLPLLAMGFDFTENLLVSWYFWNYPNSKVWIGVLASLSTLMKWTLVSLSFLYLLFLILSFLIKKIHPRRVE
ncbi:MAG TPA: hypothetical protein DEA51_01140 [Erysipelotrichaceae bacterium]|nr:hypothetical protein [Erysipelotrichaceae bacterium]